MTSFLDLRGWKVAPTRTFPIYVATGAFFAALAARGFLIPLRASELGGNRFQIGLLFSLTTFSAALLSLPAGMLADRLGRRPMLLISVITGGVSQVGIAFSSSIELDYLWQAMGGIAGAATQASLWAAVADAAHGRRLGRSMGWLTLSMQMGFLIAPALAGQALHVLSVERDILVTAVLYVVSLVALPSVGRAAARGVGPIRPIVELLRQPGLPAAAVALLAGSLIWGTLQGFLTIFGKESLGLPGPQIGLLFALQAAANGLSRIPAGRLVDRVRRRTGLISVTILGFSGSIAILPHLHGFWLPALVLVAPMPLLAIAFIAVSVEFTNLATPQSRGVAMGLYGTFLYIGLGTGPLVFGPVMQNAGYVAGFTACALTAAALVGVVAIAGREPASRGPAASRVSAVLLRHPRIRPSSREPTDP